MTSRISRALAGLNADRLYMQVKTVTEAKIKMGRGCIHLRLAPSLKACLVEAAM